MKEMHIEADRQHPVQLETDRLILRRWKQEDAEELFGLACDPEIGPAAGWSPHQTLEDSRQVLEHVLMVPEIWAVVLKATGKPAGNISLLQGKQANLCLAEGEAEIGYWIGRAYWGQGWLRGLGLCRAWDRPRVLGPGTDSGSGSGPDCSWPGGSCADQDLVRLV